MDGDRHAADAVRSTAVIPMPAEIDIANASRLAVELDASLKPGVKTLIIDMTRTTFCDSLGVRVIARTCLIGTVAPRRAGADHSGQVWIADSRQAACLM